ncbi:hypothetical protein [Helicobacter sp. L8]|uniref:hypothetical protein n=1 Tax=Helicobacter sp. L8 TaxID=2316078 RepID=UPI0013CE055A|nr:hypothetical protein [Helicobacter sp. L8]
MLANIELLDIDVFAGGERVKLPVFEAEEIASKGYDKKHGKILESTKAVQEFYQLCEIHGVENFHLTICDLEGSGMRVFVAFALVLSIAQNVHYFFKYNASIATILVITGKIDPNTKRQLEGALEVQEHKEKPSHTSTEALLGDIIKEAQKKACLSKCYF